MDESISEIEEATCIDFIDATATNIANLGLGHTRTVNIKDTNSG